MSRNDLSMAELEGYYREQEKELVQEARDFLNESGYINSGVMYTLTVHHGKIDKLCEEDRNELMAALEQINFADENSVFECRFLTN